MASNSLPTNSGQLIGLGTTMLAGLSSFGTTLKITQITPAPFQKALTAFINADSGFNAARSAKQASSDTQKEAVATLVYWLTTARNVLAGRFGNRWSTQWAQAGFATPSVALPTRIVEQLALALSIANFFAANPSYEVPSMQVTAAQGKALRDAALSAQQGLTDAALAMANQSTVWTASYDALTTMMRAVIKILAATIPSDDTRWLPFGLNIPAANTTPGQPQNVALTVDEKGAVVAQCAPVPLATRYRWRMRLVGVQKDYQLVARSTEPLAVLGSVEAGQAMEVIVQAVNGTLQGVASKPVVFTLPAIFSRKAAPAANVVELADVAPQTRNGNGNGHAPRVRAA
jgi:hypothetical protein